MEDQQKAGYPGISALDFLVYGLVDRILCPDPLYP